MKNKTKLKKSTVASALLLASSPVLASPTKGGQPPKSDDDAEQSSPPSQRETRTSKPPVNPGGKNFGPQSRLRIESITVDKAHKHRVTSCAAPTIKKKKFPRPRSVLSLAFHPKRRHTVKLLFEMSNIPANKDEHVLLLLYSRCLSKRSKIKTPLSKNKLMLDTNDIEILGTYNIPPSAKSASTNTEPTEMTIEVDLELNKLAPQVEAGNDTFYFQTALLKKTDFEKKHYGVARLSPLEAIHVTPKRCPNQQQFEDDLNSDNDSCKNLPTKTE